MSSGAAPSPPPLPRGVEELVMAAEVHATSVSEALQHFEAALSQLHNHVQGLAPGSLAHAAAVAQFRRLLTTAEQLKQQVQADPPRAEYSWRQRQAQRLADQAVAADAGGRHVEALDCYAKLLECLNRCHALETAPAARAAIMQRFQLYLERAESLRRRVP